MPGITKPESQDTDAPCSYVNWYTFNAHGAA